ncbi:transglutaminase-like cysteine peptidase [Pseudovibrio sp. SCP19]|uniref:transglutaminase-like cysteine peptidase n=1 Tax=Pseudovibrio sp. SCP19 TaxID=3141374 RepID=UPI00333B50CA
MYFQRRSPAGLGRAGTGRLCLRFGTMAVVSLLGLPLLFSGTAGAFEPEHTRFSGDQNSRIVASVPVPKIKPEAAPFATASAYTGLPKTTTKRIAPLNVVSSTAGQVIDWRWDTISSQMETHLADKNHCLNSLQKCSDPALNVWVNLIKSAKSKPKFKRLAYVNRGINALLSYKSDQSIWGQADYWASPMDALGRRQGDCEDYAILKYWSLRKLGLAKDDLKVVAVFDQRTGQYHAVLDVQYKGGSYLLDNRSGRVLLKRDRRNYQYVHTAGSGKPASVPVKFTPLSQLASNAQARNLQ